MLDEFVEEDDAFDPSSLPPYYVRKLNGFLRTACIQGHLVCVDLLVNKGADVNHVDREDNTTVIQAAILRGHSNITEYLIDKVSDNTRKTAHTYATERLTTLEGILKLFTKKDSTAQPTTADVEPQAKQETADVVVETKETTKEIEELAVDTKEVEKEIKELAKEINEVVKEKNVVVVVTADKETATENHAQNKEEIDSQVFDALHLQIKELKKSNEELQKQLEEFKKEMVNNNVTAEIERLSSELHGERQKHLEAQEYIEQLSKELSEKGDEVNSITIERDHERRAKENAKRILSLDNMNIPTPTIVRQNPLFHLSDKPQLPKGSKSIVDFSKFDIQGKGNKIHMPTELIPNKTKVEGSKDDLEIHMGDQQDRVKYRVRKLVRRWEEMTV